jgi:hypothetical protein
VVPKCTEKSACIVKTSNSLCFGVAFIASFPYYGDCEV